MRGFTFTDALAACRWGVRAVAKRRSERNAWSYEAPGTAMKKVARWVSFWDEVEVVAG